MLKVFVQSDSKLLPYNIHNHGIFNHKDRLNLYDDMGGKLTSVISGNNFENQMP